MKMTSRSCDRDEEHHADGGDQDEEDELADVLGEGGIDGEEQREDGENEKRDLNELSERIGDERCRRGGWPVRMRGQCSRMAARQPSDAESGGDGEADALVGCCAGARRSMAMTDRCDVSHDDDLGQCEVQELGVVDRVHCQLPLRTPKQRRVEGWDDDIQQHLRDRVRRARWWR